MRGDKTVCCIRLNPTPTALKCFAEIICAAGLPLTGWRVFTLPITDTSVLCFPPLAAAAPAPAPALAPAKLAASAHVKSAGHALEKALASSGSPSPQVIQSTATAAARVRAETCGAPAGANRTCAVPPLNVATDGPIFFKCGCTQALDRGHRLLAQRLSASES